MTLNPVIIETLKDNVSQLDNEDIDLVLALLQNRKCNRNLNPDCKGCSWKGSILCMPIRDYLKSMYKENEE